MEFIDEDLLIEEFMSEHETCFDRFTFDKIMRFLLAHDHSHEDAKDFILVRCSLSALVMQERIHNNLYSNIDINDEISEDLLELKNEVFNKCIAKYPLCSKWLEYLQYEPTLIAEEECVNDTYNFVLNRKFGGDKIEIVTIYGQLEKAIGQKIERASDKWDKTYGVDFFVKINERYIGIQIKSISSGKALNDYQWIEMHKKSHAKFEREFGGKVFFVFSAKNAAEKKNIHNTEVIEAIIQEIKRLSL